MKQIYEHYEKWEDFNAGMYSLNDVIDKDKKVISAINLLSNQIEFYDAMKKLLNMWKVSVDVNLTNKQQNRRAWLGAAACMFIHNTPEYLTRIAWNLLNKDVQDNANKLADKIILEYERSNNGIYKNMGEQMLF
jgi:hypothetical protein